MILSKLLKIQRKTRDESRFHPKMGVLSTKVTRIQKTILGIPFRTIHTYRETYHGEVKDIRDCRLAAV